VLSSLIKLSAPPQKIRPPQNARVLWVLLFSVLHGHNETPLSFFNLEVSEAHDFRGEGGGTRSLALSLHVLLIRVWFTLRKYQHSIFWNFARGSNNENSKPDSSESRVTQ
jgi:hypothetical protein